MAKIIKNLKSSTSNIQSDAELKQAFIEEVAAEQGEDVAAEVEMELEAGTLELPNDGQPIALTDEQVAAAQASEGKKIAAPKADTGNEIVKLVLPKDTKETEVYLITPKGSVMGTDRWFAKKDLSEVTIEDGAFVISLKRKLVASRKLLDHIVTAAPEQQVAAE